MAQFSFRFGIQSRAGCQHCQETRRARGSTRTRESGTAKPAYASPEVLAPRATGSRTIPGVNDIKTTVLEVCNIARGELGSSHLRNGRDLRIRVADRFAERTAVNGNLRKNSRCVALEPEDVARQILGKHGFGRCQQPVATIALGKQLNSIKDFCLGN
jgi:hypothetical protein